MRPSFSSLSPHGTPGPGSPSSPAFPKPSSVLHGDHELLDIRHPPSLPPQRDAPPVPTPGFAGPPQSFPGFSGSPQGEGPAPPPGSALQPPLSLPPGGGGHVPSPPHQGKQWVLPGQIGRTVSGGRHATSGLRLPPLGTAARLDSAEVEGGLLLGEAFARVSVKEEKAQGTEEGGGRRPYRQHP